MGVSTSTLHIVPAPRFAGMRTFDCARCGREEVRPVFLSDGNSYGSGCAAVMLGRPREAARKVLDEAAAVARREQAALELRRERRGRYTRALQAFSVAPNNYDPDLDCARRSYHNAGGRDRLGLLFPDWMIQVAATGTL